MNRGLLVGLAIVAIVVLVLAGTIAGSYNNLVRVKTDVDRQWGQVENQLQRRNDLVPNLVETVKGIAAQEQTVFKMIADARAQMAGARTPEQTMDASRAMDGALGRLLVVVENYPTLRSSENFMRLQDELAGTENRISVERMRYNDAVRDYNVKVQTFPSMIMAGFMGLKPKPFFEAAQGAEKPPAVRFNQGPADTTRR
jgi:LemA protein